MKETRSFSVTGDCQRGTVPREVENNPLTNLATLSRRPIGKGFFQLDAESASSVNVFLRVFFRTLGDTQGYHWRCARLCWGSSFIARVILECTYDEFFLCWK